MLGKGATEYKFEVINISLVKEQKREPRKKVTETSQLFPTYICAYLMFLFDTVIFSPQLLTFLKDQFHLEMK